jgi:uncharacterized protein
MNTTSRRQFLKTAAAGTGGALAARALPAFGGTSATVAVVPPLSIFGYSQVQLFDGPFRRQFDQNHDLFLNLNEDALLKPFRQRTGMPAPGPDMGGWYDNSTDFNEKDNFHGFVPGHSFGQYISGLARAYAITGSRATQAKVNRLVRAYAQTVDSAGTFYTDYDLPAYTFDKMCCALIDAHEFAHDPDALDVLWRTTQSAMPHLPEKALSRAEQRARPHKSESYTWDESYTLPENLFLAYQRSGNPRYRDLAIRFIEHDYFEPLADGHNILPGEHAYSHVNAFSSAMQSYLVLGDETYLRAAINGFRMIQEQSFATGGWGPNEAFVVPGSGGLHASLEKSHSSFETPCGAYAHFKITRYLMRVTGDSRYGDSMERVLYNTIGGAWPILPDGTSFYYSDYNSAARKVHHHDKWPCGWSLRQSLPAVAGLLVTTRHAVQLDADDRLSAREHFPFRVQAGPARNFCRVCAHSGVGGCENHDLRKRQAHRRGSGSRKILSGEADMERRRSHRVGAAHAVAPGAG